MFSISRNGIITVNRGDSFTIKYFINFGGAYKPEQYILKAGDKLYFALMEPHQPFEHALIRKVYTDKDVNLDGLVEMNFIPEMTEFLLPGTYYYMIKLVRPGEESGDEFVDTVCPKTKFVILD